ncbi:MAG: hypothetical protein HYY00_09360 [Chloroflexi bacterium]|nr:hypothetical protein [Chloroflexota bacterium]
MKLKPLEQWVCDFCGEVIERPEQGWIEWLADPSDGFRQEGFKIVHYAPYSPRKPRGRCYHYDNPPSGRRALDIYLSEFVGEKAMPQLLVFVDGGPYREKEYGGPRVKDLREWAELVRRLTIPYFEEARFYMKRADISGFFAGASEPWIYMPNTLKEVIRRYGDGG